jgi:hypothetical protein
MFAIEEILRKLSKQYLITLLKDLFYKSDFLRVFYATGEKSCRNKFARTNIFSKFFTSYLLYYLLSFHRVPLFNITISIA